MTAADLVAVLRLLAPLAGGMAGMLTTEFPATRCLTVRRLRERLQNFTGQGPTEQNIAIGNVGGEFEELEQTITARLQNHQMTQNSAEWARAVFRLLTRATLAQMRAFMAHGQVRNFMALGQADNPLFHLLQFARYHRTVPPAGPAAVPVAVAHAAGARQIDIDAAILLHVRERHTWEDFRFAPAIINRATRSTIFPPGLTNAALTDRIRASLQNAAVTTGAWDGSAIDVGAIQMRIVPNGPHYRISSYFYSAGAGTEVLREVLAAIHHCFPFL